MKRQLQKSTRMCLLLSFLVIPITLFYYFNVITNTIPHLFSPFILEKQIVKQTNTTTTPTTTTPTTATVKLIGCNNDDDEIERKVISTLYQHNIDFFSPYQKVNLNSLEVIAAIISNNSKEAGGTTFQKAEATFRDAVLLRGNHFLLDDNNNNNNTVNGSTAATATTGTDNDNDDDIINSSYEFLLRPFHTGGKKIVFFGDSTTLHLFYAITTLFDLYHDKNNHSHKGEVEVEAEGWKESNNNNNTIITDNNIIHVNNVLELQRQLELGMTVGKKETNWKKSTNVTGIRLVEYKRNKRQTPIHSSSVDNDNNNDNDINLHFIKRSGREMYECMYSNNCEVHYDNNLNFQNNNNNNKTQQQQKQHTNNNNNNNSSSSSFSSSSTSTQLSYYDATLMDDADIILFNIGLHELHLIGPNNTPKNNVLGWDAWLDYENNIQQFIYSAVEGRQKRTLGRSSSSSSSTKKGSTNRNMNNNNKLLLLFKTTNRVCEEKYYDSWKVLAEKYHTNDNATIDYCRNYIRKEEIRFRNENEQSWKIRTKVHVHQRNNNNNGNSNSSNSNKTNADDDTDTDTDYYYTEDQINHICQYGTFTSYGSLYMNERLKNIVTKTYNDLMEKEKKKQQKYSSNNTSSSSSSSSTTKLILGIYNDHDLLPCGLSTDGRHYKQAVLSRIRLLASMIQTYYDNDE